ncbi:MAG TPA: serine/threonine-protein kinase, partial [Longimicrobiales bacterium]|nr:serine/threonine-protein kinase [Longimicrobiales bacterium]
MSDSAAVPDRLAAALADRYRLEHEVGQGGMATVYLADDLKHERKVAVKVLRPELAAMVGAERFLTEIRTTANLQHPHILPLFDSGEADGFLWYTMPYVEGETLRDRLDREKQLSIEDAVEFTRKVGAALDYAHRHGVIHRDIKPANILVHDGEPQVSDFGIALAIQEAGSGRLTETGLSLGTPYYMSPEQATGDRDPDARSDLYSLGCMAYEMLAGEPPFTGNTAQSVLAKILTGEAPAVTQVRSTVPPHVASAIARATQRLPADRFPTIGDFLEALRDPTYRYGTMAMSSAGVGAGAASGGGSPVWKLATGAFAILAAALAAGWIATAGGGQTGVAPIYLRVAMPDSQEVRNPSNSPSMAISDDGSTMAYVGPGTSSATQIWVKRREDIGGTPLPGTDNPGPFALSGDGSEIAFSLESGPSLYAKSTAGGTTRTLSDSAQNLGLDWASDGYIYFQNFQAGISRVLGVGGAVEVLSDPSEEDGTAGSGDQTWPVAIPEAGKVLIARWGATPEADSIALLDLESGEVRTLERGVRAEYLPSGFILLGTADSNLSVARFNARSGEIEGPLRSVAGEVRRVQDGALDFAVSRAGTLL